MLCEHGPEVAARDDADARIGQSLGAISHPAPCRWKAQHGAGECEMQNLAPTVFEQLVETYPTVEEMIHRIAPLAEHEQITAGSEHTIAGTEFRHYA